MRISSSVATALVVTLMVLCCGAGSAQNSASRAASSRASSSNQALSQALRELSDQVRELRTSVAEMRADSERSHAETRQLQRELEDLRAASKMQKPELLEAMVRTASSSLNESSSLAPQDQNSPNQSTPDQYSQPNAEEIQKKAGRTATLDEEYELLAGKIDDQYQTKVESASKYRMRISGIVLMNLFSNQGVVDNIDVPELAYFRPPGNSGGSFGATLRQSQIGFEVFGPHVAGARTRADIQVDLAGGFPVEPNGSTSGLMRLRTATMRMDWENTSVVAGQDGLFMSPNSPTSFASLAEPALSYAGNLWSWVPQVRVEHKFNVGESSSLLLQGGILDPLSGEVPQFGSYRQGGPGEASRQPAYGTRIAWTRDISGRPLRLGVGGYYSRQDYGYDRKVDAWALMTDLEVPLGSKFAVSGKFYRGRALGGLYGGIGQSVLFNNNDPQEPYTQLIGLNTVGGWTQLKYRPTTKIEINAAFGMDNPYARDLEHFLYPFSYGEAVLARNHSGFANIIYRPRSDLLFSAEYRRIVTESTTSPNWDAGHLNLMMGVLF
jgi:regulator of replication initiation timing